MEEHCENCVYARFLYARLQACAKNQEQYVDAFYWCPNWRPLIFEQVGLFGQFEGEEAN